jgi:hypothetical protein
MTKTASTSVLNSIALPLIDTIESSVESIIEFGKKLYFDKLSLNRVEWRQLVNVLGWGKQVVAKYIKIGEAFESIDTEKLAKIEPRTLFTIASSKKYVAVIDQIKQYAGLVTQQFVENLMAGCRKPSIPQNENPSIWRAEKDGSRSCIIPRIKEDDDFTGMSIQRAMDVEGVTAQSFIRESVALREALGYGAINLDIECLPQQLQDVIREFMRIDNKAGSDEVIVYEYDDYEDCQSDEHKTTFRDCDSLTSSSPPPATETMALVATSSDDLDNAIDSIKAELLTCVSWSQVQAIIDNLTKDKQDIVWEALTIDQKRHLKGMKVKNRLNQSDTTDETTNIPTLQVGQYVNWDEGYPYIQSFMVNRID